MNPSWYQKVNDWVGDYADGVLSPERKEMFETYIADCPYCRHVWESYRATITACRKMVDDPAPREVADRVLNFLQQRILREKKSSDF